MVTKQPALVKLTQNRWVYIRL